MFALFKENELNWFHRHQWRIIGAADYNRKEYNRTVEQYTIVTYRCDGCDDIKTKKVSGHSANIVIRSIE